MSVEDGQRDERADDELDFDDDFVLDDGLELDELELVEHSGVFRPANPDADLGAEDQPIGSDDLPPIDDVEDEGPWALADHDDAEERDDPSRDLAAEYDVAFSAEDGDEETEFLAFLDAEDEVADGATDSAHSEELGDDAFAVDDYLDSGALSLEPQSTESGLTDSDDAGSAVTDAGDPALSGDAVGADVFDVDAGADGSLGLDDADALDQDPVGLSQLDGAFDDQPVASFGEPSADPFETGSFDSEQADTDSGESDPFGVDSPSGEPEFGVPGPGSFEMSNPSLDEMGAGEPTEDDWGDAPSDPLDADAGLEQSLQFTPQGGVVDDSAEPQVGQGFDRHGFELPSEDDEEDRQRLADAASPDDVLFDAGTLEAPSGSKFREDGSGWGGDAMSPEDVGIPVGDEVPTDAIESSDPFGDSSVYDEHSLTEGEPFANSESGYDETSLDDGYGEGELEAGSYDEGSYEDGTYEEGAYDEQLDDSDFDEYADEGSIADPIYGEGDSAQVASEDYSYEPDAAYGDPDYSDHEDSYVEQTPAGYRVVGADRPPRSIWRRVAAVAAVLLVAGGAYTVVEHPGLIGLDSTGGATGIERAVLARPRFAASIPQPTEQPDPGSDVTPAATEPVAYTAPDRLPDPRVNTVADSGAGQRVTPPTGPARPTGTEPKTGPRPPIATPPDATPSQDLPGRGLVAIGEELSVSGPTHPGKRPSAAGQPAKSERHPLIKGLLPGDQAFAQLANGNFFVGSVKRIENAQLTLRLDEGEVVLPYQELEVLTSLGSAEYDALKRAETGYVQLTNENRLRGQILEIGGSKHVVVDMKTHRVVIPRESIAEMGQEADSQLRIGREEDDDWVRSLVKQRAEKSRRPTQRPAARPDGK